MLGRIAQTLMNDGTLLSTPIARRLLDQIRRLIGDQRSQYDYTLRRTLPDVICCLPADLLAEAADGWPLDRPELQPFADTLAQVLAVIRHRQTLIHQLREA